MDQFERENTSNYTEPERSQPVGQPTQEPEWQRQDPVPVTPAPAPEKPKKSKAPLVLTLLLLLALVAAGVFGWMWYQQSGRVSDLESDLSSTRNKVSQLETSAAAEAKLNDTSDVTTDTTSSDSEAIIKSSLAYAQAGSKSSSEKLKTEITYNEDNFASVNVVPENGAGGVGLILKKANDMWVVIFSGQDNPPQFTIDQYGIPKAAYSSTN